MLRDLIFRVGFRSVSLLLVIAASTVPILAQSSRESQDVHLRNDCRLAAQTLTKGHPAPKTDWALSIIYRCDASGGPALQALWAAPTVDSVALQQLVTASSKLLDQRVYDAVTATARNTGAPRSVRFAAMRVLAAFVSNTTFIDPDDLEKTNPDTTIIKPFSTVSGGLVQFISSVPLSATAPNDIRALFATLARTDADPIVRRACRALQVRFSGP